MLRKYSTRSLCTFNAIHKKDKLLVKGISDPDDTPPVTMVQDVKTAKRIVKQLLDLGPNVFHACDTEVADIDVKNQGPVGNGFVTCLSIYSGPEYDFGNGSRIWVDNLDAAEGTLNVFKPFLESKTCKKVWHNYSFDRHVVYNHDIDVQGLGGDTMHMSRLWNTSRTHRGGYSLEALTNDLLDMRKRPMKELFGIPKLKKDGSSGKELLLPSIRDLQRSEDSRERWIRYSCYDAESTWYLHKLLKAKLGEMLWYQETKNDTQVFKSMYSFYVQYIVPFGECLTDMERKGMLVDLEKLKLVEALAIQDRKRLEEQFLQWAKEFVPDAHRMNVNSAAQKQQLLFAPFTNKRGKELLTKERAFLVENTEGIIVDGKKKALKNRDMIITGLGIPPIQNTASGLPTVGAVVLRELAGQPYDNPPVYGKAYNHFNGGEKGAEACKAIFALHEISSTNTMLTNFILPLQELSDDKGRVHCSLNLNTDTGRLSSRRPNLQNQPALEKDRYKIRDAFIAPPGKKLIVADYSQLELRLLAHVTNCDGMIQAFKAGGDFHSRTAIGMYDYVAKAVDSGEVLLEWDSSKGLPPVPLLKDKYASERKNAKILNFSIAYGKTPFGLAKDFNVTQKEAAATLDKWYADRPEVREWQQNSIRTAQLFGYTRTLMGRYRMLPDAMSTARSFAAKKAKGHAERASINTPIQGAAADVVMQAMLRIHSDEQLGKLGWSMVCQIHDEIILEGPGDSDTKALERVVHLMENPFKKPLSVHLEVDAKVDTSWYKAK